MDNFPIYLFGLKLGLLVSLGEKTKIPPRREIFRHSCKCSNSFNFGIIIFSDVKNFLSGKVKNIPLSSFGLKLGTLVGPDGEKNSIKMEIYPLPGNVNVPIVILVM